MEINKAIVTGRLTAAPDLRYTPNGVAVANFTIAVDRPFTDQQGNRQTDFFPVVIWRGAAESAANYLEKGQEVVVEGRLQNRQYEDKSTGKKITVTEIIADNIKFGSKPKPKGNRQENQPSSQSADSQQTDDYPF